MQCSTEFEYCFVDSISIEKEGALFSLLAQKGTRLPPHTSGPRHSLADKVVVVFGDQLRAQAGRPNIGAARSRQHQNRNPLLEHRSRKIRC